jgi:hypothetical protein
MPRPRRPCAAIAASGRPCGSSPPHDSEYCLFHDPEQREAAAAARRAGGQRRRRSSSLEAIFDLGDIRTSDGLWSLLQVAAYDLVLLDNSIARARAIVAVVAAGARLLDGDLERRVAALEAGLKPEPAASDREAVEGTLLDGPDLDGEDLK